MRRPLHSARACAASSIRPAPSSVRASASDDQGGSVKQEIIRAVGVRK
ncbi:hypothetical protein ACIQ6K_39660 [Streptomyces sp. NPDC096354]